MKKNTVILIIVTILLVGTGIVAWQTGMLDRFLPTGSENSPTPTPTEKVESSRTETSETTLTEETISTAAVQEDSTSPESSVKGTSETIGTKVAADSDTTAAKDATDNTDTSNTAGTSDTTNTQDTSDNTGTSDTTKETSTVKSVPDSTENMSSSSEQKEIWVEMHKMINTKIIAEEIWGTIEITTDKVDEVIAKVNESTFSETDKEKLLQILNNWKKEDFSDAVNEHNYLWEKLDGTVGRATGLKDTLEN